MARVSTKTNKSIYQKTRENLQMTREKASELLESITPERISITVETLQLWSEEMLVAGWLDGEHFKLLTVARILKKKERASKRFGAFLTTQTA